jgi:hypothetical protein
LITGTTQLVEQEAAENNGFITGQYLMVDTSKQWWQSTVGSAGLRKQHSLGSRWLDAALRFLYR